jgi:hypothetical protein
MVRIKKNIRGAFLVEAVMLLIPFILMMFFLLEAFRREIFQVLLIHITCAEARALSLGESRKQIEWETQAFLNSALGSVLGEQIERQTQREFKRVIDPSELRWLKVGKLPGGVSERRLRYEQFISFELQGKRKHHQEIVKRCLFPFS